MLPILFVYVEENTYMSSSLALKNSTCRYDCLFHLSFFIYIVFVRIVVWFSFLASDMLLQNIFSKDIYYEYVEQLMSDYES